jgi:hypothetical protein
VQKRQLARRRLPGVPRKVGSLLAQWAELPQALQVVPQVLGDESGSELAALGLQVLPQEQRPAEPGWELSERREAGPPPVRWLRAPRAREPKVVLQPLAGQTVGVPQPQASSAQPSLPLLWLLFPLWQPLLPELLPQRLPGFSCELFPRRRPEWSSNESFFP